MNFSIFDIKRACGLGLALAAFFVAAGPYLPEKFLPSTKTQKVQAVTQPDSQQLPLQPAATPAAPEESTASLQTPETPENVTSDTSALPLEQLKILEFQEEGFNWRKDWWKLLTIAVGTVLVLYIALRVVKMAMRLALFAVCVAAGIVGALIAEPMLSPWLESRMPESISGVITPSHGGYALGFLAFYIAALTVLYLLRKPLSPKNFEEK